MKKLILILLFSTVIFSSPSYAEWTGVSEGTGTNSGNFFYVDFERMRKHDGYVYWWNLTDFLKPTEYGDFSAKSYHQGDCKLFRFKKLSFSFHKEPMGGGTGEMINKPDKEWTYPSPNSVNEIILKAVCNR
jgi:hypothetical protein